jgi:ribosomal-protein-alanine N-acetyltransferase
MVDEHTIRQMGGEDIDGVMNVERESFPSPWPRELFEEEITRDFSHSLVISMPGMTEVAGYIVFWIVYDECHVLNIAVHPSIRRKGLGALLMKKCEEIAVEKEVSRIYLEVRESNVAGRELYCKLGFNCLGIRRKYYSDTGEDARVMIKSIQRKYTCTSPEK